MPFTYPSPIEFNARGSHSATVILLHGLGDTGDGWSFFPSQLSGDFKHVKFIFPHAPTRPITLNMGMRMTGWYDIISLDKEDAREDEEGLLDSKKYIERLVQAEVDRGIPSDRVVVAGFSQGGAISLLMLRSELKLGGIVGLSTYLTLRGKTPLISDANKDTPVLMCHGDADPLIAHNFGTMSKDLLAGAGAKVEFKTYRGMGHSACPEELKDIEAFLSKVLPAK